MTHFIHLHLHLHLRQAALVTTGLLLCILATTLAATDEPENDTSIVLPPDGVPIDFQNQILPIFQKSCLACHNTTRSKADLILETPQTIAKGSEYGPVIIPGNGGESKLFLLAAGREEPLMPPEDNRVNAPQLSPQELGILKVWIDQGAKGPTKTPALDRTTTHIDWQTVPNHLGAILSLAISSDGQYVACGRANQISIYHIPSKRLVQQLTDPGTENNQRNNHAAHHDMVHSLAFSPNGRVLASGGYRAIKLWRRPREVRKWHKELLQAEESHDAEESTKGEAPLVPLDISPNGKWIATAGPKHSIVLWDSSAPDQIKSLIGHTSPVRSICFSPDSTQLASAAAGEDKSIRIWRLEDANQIAVAQVEEDLYAVTWIGGEADIASGGAGGEISIWKLDQSQEVTLLPVRSLGGHSDSVTCLDTIWPSGEKIVSGSKDGTVRIWNIPSGEQLHQLEHGAAVTAVSVRPDAQRIASAGSNHIVALWNAVDGSRIAELQGDRYAIERVNELERFTEFTKEQKNKWSEALKTSEEHQKISASKLVDLANQRTEKRKDLEEAQLKLENTEKDQSEAEEVKQKSDKRLEQGQKDVQRVEEALERSAQLVRSFDELANTLQARSNQAEEAYKLKSQAASELEASSHQANAVAEEKVQAADTARELADKAALETEADDSDGTKQADADAKQREAFEALAEADQIARDLRVKQAAAEQAQKQMKDADERVEAEQKITADISEILKTIEQVKEDAVRHQEGFQAEVKQAKDRLDTTKKATKENKDAVRTANRVKENSEGAYRNATVDVRDMVKATLDASDNLTRTRVELEHGERALKDARKTSKDRRAPLHTVAFSPNNRILAMGGAAPFLATFDAESGNAFETYPVASGAVTALAYTHEGDLIATTTKYATTTWQLDPNWELDHVITPSENTDGNPPALVGRVLALAFSPEGNILAAGSGVPSRSGTISLWRMPDGEPVKQLPESHSDTIFSLQFSPDGRYLASGAADKLVNVFHASNGELTDTFEGHTHHVLDVTWHRGSQLLASSGADKVVNVWDTKDGERVENFSIFKKHVTSIQYLAYKNELVVSAGDPKVGIVKHNGEGFRELPGPGSYMYCTDATADGKIVAAGGDDGVLYIWDHKGKLIAEFHSDNTEAQTEELDGEDEQ